MKIGTKLYITIASAVVLVLVAVFGMSNTQTTENKRANLKEADGESVLCSHYFDVGQGDAAFIELPNGECMLIDAGDGTNTDDIISYVSDCGYDELNYVVATHPHADHIGGMEDIVMSMKIGKLYMPKTDCDTQTYEDLLSAVSSKGMNIHIAKAGVNILTDEELSVDIISPTRSYYELNNTSAVVSITFGETRFLYMGDVEAVAENDIMTVTDVSCDVIKVGHHGSDTSSCAEFISRTGADYAVISVGKDNSYGHPSSDIIKAWKNSGASVYRTDKHGSVTILSDSTEVWVG